MDLILLIGCSTLGILLLFIAWQLSRRSRRPHLKSSLLIADCLQPQLVCRPVPCQHPYYRVISECSEHKVPVGPLDPITVKVDVVQKPEPIDQKEWYRTLSLSSIPRKSGHSSSRRSSTSDLADRNSPVRITKARSPTFA